MGIFLFWTFFFFYDQKNKVYQQILRTIVIWQGIEHNVYRIIVLRYCIVFTQISSDVGMKSKWKLRQNSTRFHIAEKSDH